MRKYLILIVLFFASLTTVTGQKSYYVNASILTTENKVYDGYIEHLTDLKITTSVNFKQQPEDSELQLFAPGEIKHIILTQDSTVYEPVKYAYIIDSVELSEFRLAKKLVTGYASLYKLQLPRIELKTVLLNEITFIYVVRIKDEDHILRLNEYVIDVSGSGLEGAYSTEGYRVDRKYIPMLKTLFNDNSEIADRLENLKFNDDALSNIVDRYNNSTHPEIASSVLQHKSKPVIFHGPMALFSADSKFGPEYGAGYYMNYCDPEQSKRISLFTGIFYTDHFNRDEGIQEQSSPFLRIPVQANYQLANTRISPFIFAGATGIKYLEGRYGEIVFDIGVGCVFYNRVLLRCAYERELRRVDRNKVFSCTLGYNFNNPAKIRK